MNDGTLRGRDSLQRRVLVALAMLPICLGAAGCEDATTEQAGGPPPAPPVSVATPVVKPIVEMDDFTGRFEAVDFVEIRSRVGGYIRDIHFSDGGIVEQGALLFTIDPRPFEAELVAARAAVTIAQTQLNFAGQELERARRLRQSGNAAQATLDERRQQYAEAEAEIERAKAAQTQAGLDLEFTAIRAPFRGRASRNLLSIGNLVNANETVLTTIAAVESLHFYFDVDERTFMSYERIAGEAGRPAENNKTIEVDLRIDGEEKPRRGVLDFVDNRLDEQTGTMRARALVPNLTKTADGNPIIPLTPGMFGVISVPASPLYDAVLIPDEAIASDQDRRIVYVLQPDNAVLPVPIRPGPRHDGYRIVRSGLNGTETIVVNGLMRVRPGTKVTPQPIVLPPVKP